MRAWEQLRSLEYDHGDQCLLSCDGRLLQGGKKSAATSPPHPSSLLKALQWAVQASKTAGAKGHYERAQQQAEPASSLTAQIQSGATHLQADPLVRDGSGNLFNLLPMALVQDIIARCDIRSASVAARACRLTHQAHVSNSFFEPSSLFDVYIEAMDQINRQGKYGGGAWESYCQIEP